MRDLRTHPHAHALTYVLVDEGVGCILRVHGLLAFSVLYYGLAAVKY